MHAYVHVVMHAYVRGEHVRLNDSDAEYVGGLNVAATGTNLYYNEHDFYAAR